MAAKKEQPASPFGWVNSMRNFSSKIRRTPNKSTTTLGAGTGAGIMKSAGENYQQTGIKKAIRETSNYTRTDLLAKARAEEGKSVVKTAPKGPSIAQKRASFTAANAPVSKNVLPAAKSAFEQAFTKSNTIKSTVSGMGVANISKAAPARTYTEKEKQISSLLMTGKKKKDGTLKASTQRKIQKIRKK
jgi:hypothetical protein